MKRFGIALEVGKSKEFADRKQKAADKMKTAEALARMVDRNLIDAVAEAGKTLDSYVESLNHIWSYSDKGNYKLAIEMMHVLCMALDKDASIIVEEIIMPDYVMTEMFMDYFGEYITDGYLIDRILSRAEAACCVAEDEDDDNEEKEELFDIHYEEVKGFFDKESDENE